MSFQPNFPRAVPRFGYSLQPPGGMPAPAQQQAPAPPPPPSGDTEESFYTALTQPQNETPPDDEEDKDVPAEDPFAGLWGRLVPCNPEFDTIDLHTERPVLRVGRLPSNDLIIPSGKISGHHCEIGMMDEGKGEFGVRVFDTSTNGTYINGVRIKRRAYGWIQHGDELSLGLPTRPGAGGEDFRFIFRKSSGAIKSGNGFYAHWETGPVLGSGSFATVYKAYSKVTGEVAAVKMIAKSRFAHNPKTKEMFERELAILQSLKHHNITRLLDYYEDESTLFIVMELVQGGDLLEFIVNNGPVPEHNARVWTAQMVDAIYYTHRKGVAHRDLKPENVLMTSEPRVVKVADFGLAKKDHSKTMLTTMCGTPSYLAPEVILGNNGEGYEKIVDCWSLGVIVFAMLTNTNCFTDSDSQDLRTKMANRVVQWDTLRSMGVSDQCMDFVQKLIVADPTRRMSMRRARQHPWIRDVVNLPPEGFEPDTNFSQPESQSQGVGSQGSVVPYLNTSLRASQQQAPQTILEEDETTEGLYTRAGTEAPHGGSDMSGMSSGLGLPSSGTAFPALANDLADLNIETETVHGGGADTDNSGSFVHTSAGPSPVHKTSAMDVDESYVQVPRPATPKTRAPTVRGSTKRKAQVMDQDPAEPTAGASERPKAKAPRTSTRARAAAPAPASPEAPAKPAATKSRRQPNRIRAPSPSDDDEPPVAGPSTRRSAAAKATAAAKPQRQLQAKAQRVR